MEGGGRRDTIRVIHSKKTQPATTSFEKCMKKKKKEKCTKKTIMPRKARIQKAKKHSPPEPPERNVPYLSH